MFFPMQYNRVTWGLIVALVDIRIGPVDIIPDFFGYILISMGLSELSEQHPYYGKAKRYSTPLILLSLSDLYKTSGNNLIDFPGLHAGIFMTFASLATMTVKLFMVYYICRAVMELSHKEDFQKLHNKAKFRWKAYLFINIAMMVFISFGINMSPEWAVCMRIPVVIAVIVEILLINLVYKAGKELTQ